MRIDEMQAGREMDALVAEKVMGWERWNGQWFDKNTEELQGNIVDLQFSTNIAAAWKVDNAISKMEGHVQLGYVQALHLLLKIPFNQVLNVGEELRLIRATPEQRCRAALKAVLGGDELCHSFVKLG